MANLFTDTKNKIHGIFIYLVSCGKSSKEPGNDQQGLEEDHGLVIITGNEQDGFGPIVPINNEPDGNAQVNGPVLPISDEGQQDFAIFPPGDPRNNLIIYEPEDEEEKDKANNNTNEQYHGGPVKPEGKAKTSQAPAKRKAIDPGTG